MLDLNDFGIIRNTLTIFSSRFSRGEFEADSPLPFDFQVQLIEQLKKLHDTDLYRFVLKSSRQEDSDTFCLILQDILIEDRIPLSASTLETPVKGKKGPIVPKERFPEPPFKKVLTKDIKFQQEETK